uniref:Uncharacterized protein n=1 Tax=Dromaius novaehollandiae TaxID=8790 RepID=A0A8C4PE63_DRONO
MASVASVAVELYEFCFFLLPFPHGLWEAAAQSKVSCLMYGLRSTAVHNLFKMCLSELMELTEQPTNTSISHGYVQVLVEAFIANTSLITPITLEPAPGTSLLFSKHMQPACLM